MRSARKIPRVVVDTNLFISGTILKTGKPFELLEAWRAHQFTLLLSHEQAAEIAQVLQRPQIQEKYDIPVEEIELLLRLLEIDALVAPLRRRLPVRLRDSKDDIILASAMGGKADYLVTGDKDLLAIKANPRLGTLAVVTVSELLEILAQNFT